MTSPEITTKKHLPRSQRAAAMPSTPLLLGGGTLTAKIISPQRPRIVHTAINRRRGTEQGSIWDRCLQRAAGRTKKEWGDFVLMQLLHAWLKKRKKQGDSLFSFLVRNKNCYVRHREHGAEMRTPAGGAQTNWTKTKAALSEPCLLWPRLPSPLVSPSLSHTLC